MIQEFDNLDDALVAIARNGSLGGSLDCARLNALAAIDRYGALVEAKLANDAARLAMARQGIRAAGYGIAQAARS